MNNKLILLIDSEDGVREVLKTCLRYLGGWNVLSVASFQEGVNTLHLKQPDAIVLDLPVTEVDGWGCIQYLKNSPLVHATPILLISAKASWLSPQQLKEMGIVGAIAKPFNSRTLPLQIASILGWSLGSTADES